MKHAKNNTHISREEETVSVNFSDYVDSLLPPENLASLNKWFMSYWALNDATVRTEVSGYDTVIGGIWLDGKPRRS